MSISAPTPLVAGTTVYSVSHLNRWARDRLEQGQQSLWVEGEVANLARPPSGHLYFSLKDSQAQLRCVLFRPAAASGPSLANGMQIVLRGRLSIYEPRGDMQLIGQRWREAGWGALWRQYQELRQRLEKEGLLAAERKRKWPSEPRAIGVVTAVAGAALQDVLTVLERRYPMAQVIVYPTLVQGLQAPSAIVAALQRAAGEYRCDVLLLVRGGGSLQDLWAFNSESVARAVAASPLPVVTGIGHETDVTMADLVADKRAATPSAAAELVSPDQQVWRQREQILWRRLQRALVRVQDHRQGLLSALARRLQHQYPLRRIERGMQRQDELERRLEQAWQRKWQRTQLHFVAAGQRLRRVAAAHRQGRLLEQNNRTLSRRLRTAFERRWQQYEQRLQSLGGRLNTLSPLAVLGRGYAIVNDEEGRVVRDIATVKLQQRIWLQLRDGKLCGRVEEVNALTPPR